MPNGLLNELEFEKQIKEMRDRPLLEFIARQTWETASKCKTYEEIMAAHDKRITSTENGNRKTSGIMGGITGLISGVVIAIISYFTKGN